MGSRAYLVTRPETVIIEYTYVVMADSEEEAEEKLTDNDYVLVSEGTVKDCVDVHDDLITVELYEQ